MGSESGCSSVERTPLSVRNETLLGVFGYLDTSPKSGDDLVGGCGLVGDGSEVRIGAFVQHAGLVVAAAVLVVVVRAVTTYSLVSTTNLTLDRPVPVYCQHVMVWGGLHTVVPVALVLSLPDSFPFREELQVMVFGVAVISIVVQGLLMPAVLSRVGMGDSSGR